MAAFALNTRLFLNALEGVSDDEAVRRPNDRINSMSFIAAHLVDVRHYMLAYLGTSSHHIGQLALLRKHHGHAAMSYR